MGKEGPLILNTHDPFPELEVQVVSGETLKLPEATGEDFSIVLFYRGVW